MDTEHAEFELTNQHLVMPGDLNPNHTIFGGVLLAWLDVDAYLYSVSITGYTSMVTVGMDKVKFRSPARAGEIVRIYCRVKKTGRSTITVEARATVSSPKEDKSRIVIDCEITYVAIDESGKPKSIFSQK